MTQRDYPKSWTAKFLAKPEIPEGIQVTSASVVIFNKGRIIAILQPRGLDITGGHLDPGEDIETAIRRESKEEANVLDFSKPELSCVILTERGCMVSYVAELKAMGEFIPSDEASARLEILPDDFVADERTGEITKEIVRRAVIKLQNPGIEMPELKEVKLVIGK